MKAKDIRKDDLIGFRTADGKRHKVRVRGVRYREVLVDAWHREYELTPNEEVELYDRPQSTA